jgi:hypothetical protein
VHIALLWVVSPVSLWLKFGAMLIKGFIRNLKLSCGLFAMKSGSIARHILDTKLLISEVRVWVVMLFLVQIWIIDMAIANNGLVSLDLIDLIRSHHHGSV